jgi:hypothetical protein
MRHWIIITVMGVLSAGMVGCSRQIRANADLLKANADRYRWVTAREREMQSGFDSIEDRIQRPIGGFAWSAR